eukprot:TRINITY_DN2566_c0_g1_i1.p1 TRINITY_DN2566_c0_g1~~TRINITY_DN2566_c0_g1_i1.p1  ORF type:complete len:448 (+),score=151.19 TRINITY_DN2566_c0_g1_i1:101-1345(+)
MTAGEAPKDAGCQRYGRAGVACLAYVSFSSLLIVLNRQLMKAHGFPHPMALSGLGLLGTAMVAALSVRAGWTVVKPETRELVSGRVWWSHVLPVALGKASTLAFSNWAYLYLNMGFIQMLKAFTPSIILLMLYLFGVESPTRPVMMSVLVICAGTALTTAADPSANLIGLLLQLGAMATEAVAVVLTQWFLQNAKFGVMEGAYVLAPPGAAALFLCAIPVEGAQVWARQSWLAVADAPHLFLAAAFLGVGVNLCAFVVIQCTSSLTFKIIMTLRNIAIVVFSVVMFDEAVTQKEWVGYAVMLLGFAAYNYSKMAPPKKLRRKSAHKDTQTHPVPQPQPAPELEPLRINIMSPSGSGTSCGLSSSCGSVPTHHVEARMLPSAAMRAESPPRCFSPATSDGGFLSPLTSPTRASML